MPVIWACCAMSTEGSMAMDDGFGSIEVRFGAVDVRRSGARVGMDWDDMAGIIVV
jgi:hypothetical protein